MMGLEVIFMLDYLIRGATLLDGSGKAGYVADLGIIGNKIAAIGENLGETAHVMDGRGYCLSPGFLDIHRHGDGAAFRPGYGELELRQGLTTVVNGACGLSLAPFGNAHRVELLHYLSPVTGSPDPAIPTESMAAYLDALAKRPLPLNVGMMVGGGTVRADLFGYGPEEPSSYTQIHQKLEQSLQTGALAVSLGLGYAPECFYSTQGLIRALAPLRNSQIPICVHMREEGDRVCEALQEMLEVSGALNCPLHISHLKAMGMRNWNKRIPHALELMEQERQKGQRVSCDVYLYEAGTTQLLHLLPTDFLVGGVDAICRRLEDPLQREILKERIATGRDFDNIAQMVGWENITLSAMDLPEHQDLIGRNVAEAAEELRMHPVDCICHLLARERCSVTMIDRITCEEDIARILADPHAAVISDATYPDKGLPHPRVYGNVARLFERFVYGLQTISLAEAVRKLTSLPAGIMGLKTKGLLKAGMDADLNLFRPEEFKEMGSYLNPKQYAQGMDTVFVMGKPVIYHGERTGQLTGEVLRRSL